MTNSVVGLRSLKTYSSLVVIRLEGRHEEFIPSHAAIEGHFRTLLVSSEVSVSWSSRSSASAICAANWPLPAGWSWVPLLLGILPSQPTFSSSTMGGNSGGLSTPRFLSYSRKFRRSSWMISIIAVEDVKAPMLPLILTKGMKINKRLTAAIVCDVWLFSLRVQVRIKAAKRPPRRPQIAIQVVSWDSERLEVIRWAASLQYQRVSSELAEKDFSFQSMRAVVLKSATMEQCKTYSM